MKKFLRRIIKNEKVYAYLRYLYFKYGYIKHIYSKKDHPESVYFYTFHKCASSLFQTYVLKNIDGLFNIDYEAQLYLGMRQPDKKLPFRERGIIYGPIRLTSYTAKLAGGILVKATAKPEFIREKIAIFLIRDPRDILVSAYYSFGYTHGLSPVEEIRKKQLAKRIKVQKQSIDEFVLSSADFYDEPLNTLQNLSNACNHSVILKYEDMIHNFDSFANSLRKYIDIDDNVVNGLYQKTRPRKKENTSSHRRSGETEGFRSKLQDSTIFSLNNKFADFLDKFDYKL